MTRAALSRRAVLAGLAALAAGQGRAAGSPAVGLILVGASWCPVCKDAAPVVALAAQRLQCPVLVASHDNRPIPPFPAMVPAAGHPIAGAITTLPTTLVWVRAEDRIAGRIAGYRDAGRFLADLARILDAAGAGDAGR